MKGYRNILKLMTALMAVLLLAASLTFTGCGGGGGSSYDQPKWILDNAPLKGHASNVLIDAATLKGWIDAGLVNRENSFDGRVVIIDVGDAADFNAGHIPGAQLWTNNGINRFEGPVLSSNMVLDGAAMDAYLQQMGIDEQTTVVFAGKSNPARIYFMFRYWGFAKEQLKVLDGNKAAWTTTYPGTLVTSATTPASGSCSVRDLDFNPDVRAALSELIIGVKASPQTIQPLNSLINNTEKAAGTTGIFDPSGDYVIFQGSITGAGHIDNAAYYSSGKVKTATEIKALLTAVGIDGKKPIATYCRAGNAASYAFMPIDMATDYDVMVYDGSWSQWGSLTTKTGADYVPDASYALPGYMSGWATDGLISWYTLNNGDYAIPANQIAGPYYNVKFPKTIEKPAFRTLDTMLAPTDKDANSVEIEDRAYFEAGTPTSTEGPSSGGGGGC